MWPDFMPGDPDRNKKKEWNPIDNNQLDDDFFHKQLDDDFFHKPDHRAPIDRFLDDPEQYEEDQRNREKDGMQPVIQKRDKSKGDKDKGKNSTKRGFLHGFLHPDGSSSGTAPSTIVGGESLVMDAAGGIAKSEAAAASTSKAVSAALSSAKYAKAFGKLFGTINVAITIVEGAIDGKGFTKGDGGKVVIAVATVLTPVGWVYGIIDVGTMAITKTSLTDRVGSGIDNIK